MDQNNIYEVCPTYESETFLLRLVSMDDAEDLMECYDDPDAQKFFNSDGGPGSFHYSPLSEMQRCIASWLKEYKRKYYVRFSIIDKQKGKVVGTVEMFPELSVLRIDILSLYEDEEHLSELLILSNSFFYDFKIDKIITKAIPEAEHRINALTQNGYKPYPKSSNWNRECYYIKRALIPNPYDRCPTYESKSFMLRLVSTDDVADLLECYRNPTVSVQANSENCVYGYGSQTLEEMQDCVERWLEAYRSRGFVRFSIIESRKSKAVGTIEIFNGGHHSHSILRIDVMSKYENKEHLNELLNIAEAFFYDFGCEKIVTKAVPEADERITALTNNGYLSYPVNDEWQRKDFYIKRGRNVET